jgi:Helix-turn-helix.
MKTAEEYKSPLIEKILGQITAEERERIRKRMLLAARIDEELKSKNMKKVDFARALNKRPSEITKWLSGTHNFTADTLFDIERILEIKLINITEPQVGHANVQIIISTEKTSIGNLPYDASFYNQLSNIQSFETMNSFSNQYKN